VTSPAPLREKKDIIAGGLMMVLGCGAAFTGSTYRLGTLSRMGPGFVPVALGILLALLGAVIALNDWLRGSRTDAPTVWHLPDPRGSICIVAGVFLFIVLGNFGGLMPATFGLVFVSSLGDRSSTFKRSLLLASGLAVFGSLLFRYPLAQPFPLFQWGAP